MSTCDFLQIKNNDAPVDGELLEQYKPSVRITGRILRLLRENMKPLKRFFGLRLQTGVKTVCKTLVALSAVIFVSNLYFLDYPGPREETKTSLGVVALFLFLLTASAFTGHSGAYRESLNLTFLSLGCLMATLFHWTIVALISMSKGNVDVIMNVCVQLRCPETLWMANIGFRDDKLFKRKIAGRQEGVGGQQLALLGIAVEFIRNKTFSDENSEEGGSPILEENKEDVAVKERPEKEGTFDSHNGGDQDSSGGIWFGLGLLLVIIFSYFVACAIVICSYAAELNERMKDLGEEEGIDEQVAKED